MKDVHPTCIMALMTASDEERTAILQQTSVTIATRMLTSMASCTAILVMGLCGLFLCQKSVPYSSTSGVPSLKACVLATPAECQYYCWQWICGMVIAPGIKTQPTQTFPHRGSQWRNYLLVWRKIDIVIVVVRQL